MDGGDAAIDAGDAADAGPPIVEGRVLIVQQAAISPPAVWTRAWFALEQPCPAERGSPQCHCEDSEIGGCVSRHCEGRAVPPPSKEGVLGYAAGDGLQIEYRSRNAGPLVVGDGTSLFTHEAPYDAHDPLPAPWQPGEVIAISTAGAEVPPFSVQVPYPSAVTFLEPDLTARTVRLPSNTLDIRWTAAQGPGSVEATIVDFAHPDAAYSYTVVKCSVPVESGEMTLPVPGESAGFANETVWRALAVRVINRVPVQSVGLRIDAVVASFDTGPLDEDFSTPDGGTADATSP